MFAIINGVNPIMTSRRPQWYRSLYFRIGFSFVVFVVGVVVAQSAIFSYVLARSNPFPNRSPNNLAAIVAADVGSRLAENPELDIGGYLANEYGRIRFPVFVVMKDGRAAANTATTLPQTLRRSVDAMLSGVDVRRSGREALLEGGAPIVMAPIQVAGELRGMVVMPPPIGAESPVVRDVSRLLSFPGNLLLIVATVIVAAIVFEPARRRLKALEHATERLGAGDLAPRASERGGDEIARVAGAFNRMAIEQVVENLVANALRHTPDRGRIELRAESAKGAIVISVADSGTGVPSEHLPYVFDRFYKVDEARSNGSGGSGLGLSIAKAIVERHGGTIGLVSQPGRTVFTITLPQKVDGSAYSTSENL